MRSRLTQYKKRIVSKLKGAKGLNGLDLELIKEIKPNPRRPGFYVELGANDGMAQSNTYLLQKRYNWSGLLIEPSPTAYFKCLKNRSFGNVPVIICSACVQAGFKDRFVEIEESNLMSTCKGLQLSDHEAKEQADKGSTLLEDKRQRIVYGSLAKTLADILEETLSPKCIDLLSLDVEGNELSVLQGIDFNKTIFEWILVEARNTINGHNAINELLAAKGFEIHRVLTKNDSYQDILFRARGLSA